LKLLDSNPSSLALHQPPQSYPKIPIAFQYQQPACLQHNLHTRPLRQLPTAASPRPLGRTCDNDGRQPTTGSAGIGREAGIADPAGHRASGPVDFFTTGFFEPGGFAEGGSEELLEFLPSFSSSYLIRFSAFSNWKINP